MFAIIIDHLDDFDPFQLLYDEYIPLYKQNDSLFI